MRKYNQRPDVKERKAEYMRRVRSEDDRAAARRLVNVLLDYGFEDWAFDVARERAPEMLVKAKARSRRRS